MTIWLDQFTSIESLKYEFSLIDSELEGVEILLAYYSYENYSGDAFVLFRKDGQYFEVHGSHCSCYGLEGQWKPEPIGLDDLGYRFNHTYAGSDIGYGFEKRIDTYGDAMRKLLSELAVK